MILPPVTDPAPIPSTGEERGNWAVPMGCAGDAIVPGKVPACGATDEVEGEGCVGVWGTAGLLGTLPDRG